MNGIVVWPNRRLRLRIGFNRLRPAQFFARKLSSQHSYVVYLALFGVQLTAAVSWYPPGYRQNEPG